MDTVHLREPSDDRIKPRPKASSIAIPFSYASAPDGIDENILILLHGLGDTQLPFVKLGHKLNLPQTAILALRAPERLPFLYEEAWQWYTSFNQLGELINRPNPTPALDRIAEVLHHLTHDCLWPPQRIHLLGYGQGGSVAAESGIKWWRLDMERHTLNTPTEARARALGSIVSISGPMLSYPTLSKACTTPLLVFHRPQPAESALPPDALVDFKRAYEMVVEVEMDGEGMPRSTVEWEPIIRFWAERLGRRQVDGSYEVMTGPASCNENACT